MLRYRIQYHSRGFTLLEVLIVVSIVALLASVLTVAIGRSITQAKIVATRATLNKIDTLLQQNLEALAELLSTPQRKNEITARAKEYGPKDDELQSAGALDLGVEIRKLLVIKDYYRQGFPQTQADYRNLSTGTQYFAGNAQNSAESAEYLYWIITQADNVGVEGVGSDEFTSSQIADTDGDTRMEFIDAWGQPLRFYRWPTRLIRAAPPGAWTPMGSLPPVNQPIASLFFGGLDNLNILQRDPNERLGLFSAQIAKSSITTARFDYEKMYLSGGASSYPQSPTTPAPAPNDPGYFATHTGDTYHAPLVVSGGPDRDTGLYEPWDCANYGRLAQPRDDVMGDPLNSALNDNLTNRQRQLK